MSHEVYHALLQHTTPGRNPGPAADAAGREADDASATSASATGGPRLALLEEVEVAEATWTWRSHEAYQIRYHEASKSASDADADSHGQHSHDRGDGGVGGGSTDGNGNDGLACDSGGGADGEIVVSFEDGGTGTFDFVWLATGGALDLSLVPVLASLQSQRPIATSSGLPQLQPDLSWDPKCPVHVMGAFAQLQLGPDALNLAGARSGGVLVARAILADGLGTKAAPPQTLEQPAPEKAQQEQQTVELA